MSDAEKGGKVEAACGDSKTVFHMTALSGDSQPLGTMLENGEVGMAPASSDSHQRPRCFVSQVSFLLLQEAEHLLTKVTALIPTARSCVCGWPLLVTPALLPAIV